MVHWYRRMWEIGLAVVIMGIEKGGLFPMHRGDGIFDVLCLKVEDVLRVIGFGL